jgi:integrase/recombinase XerD
VIFIIKDPYEYLKEYLDRNSINGPNRSIVDTYFRDMKLQGLRPKTIEFNSKVIIFLLEHIENSLDKLTDDDSKMFQEALMESGYAESSQKQYIINFKRFLRWYGENRRFPNRLEYLDIAKSIKRKFNIPRLQPSELLTEEEIIRMIDLADNVRDKALIAVLAESGCRIGELTATRVKDVKFNERGAELTFTETKGNVGPRTVILIFAASYLATYLEYHRNRNSSGFQNSHLFITDKVQQYTVGKKTEYAYKALDPDTIRLLLKAIAERAHIKKRVYPHLFRHCRATQLSQKFTEPKLRGYMGWAPGSSMPSRYTHLSAQDMENAIYEMYGLVTVEKEKGLEVMVCKRCKKPVPTGVKFCYNCYYPVSSDVETEIQQKMLEVYSILSLDPTVLPEMIAKLQGKK